MQLWSDARCAVSPVPGETTLNTNATLCGGFPLGSPAACQVRKRVSVLEGVETDGGREGGRGWGGYGRRGLRGMVHGFIFV